METKFHAYTQLPEYLTPEECAELARVHRQSVYRWIDRGLLSATRFGGRVRIARADLAAFIANSGSGHHGNEGGL